MTREEDAARHGGGLNEPDKAEEAWRRWSSVQQQPGTTGPSLIRYWASATALAAVACLLWLALATADRHFAAQCVEQQESHKC